MKTILEALMEGSARDRLAVIADLISIVGISIASIAAGLFALVAKADKLHIENIFFATIVSLLVLAAICIFIVLFIWVLHKMSESWGAHRGVQFFVKYAVCLIFISIFLIAIFTFYEFISSFRYFS